MVKEVFQLALHKEMPAALTNELQDLRGSSMMRSPKWVLCLAAWL